MGRKVVGCMNRIFEILEEKVLPDDSERIVEVTRHICASGDEPIVVEFVKNAKILKDPFRGFPACVFSFVGKKYLLVVERFADAIREIGFNELVFADEGDSCDLEIIQGCEMLGIGEKVLDVSPSINSMDIIDGCLGMGEGESDIEFPFCEVRRFFECSIVFEIDDARFPLLYTEDFYRLVCYCMCEERRDLFDMKTRDLIRNTLLLDSSRSVAASIENAIKSSIEEYAFLQFYQCLEYLFRLNNSFTIKSLYKMGVNESIDLVTAYEFKLSECENLRRVLIENTSESDIDKFLIATGEPFNVSDTREKKTDAVAQYIYKIRCKVAHLRYEPNPFRETIDWKKLMAAVVELVFAIYQHCDRDIVTSCNIKNVWEVITI